MAADREKRATAGNRLAKLLTEEEEDDFYKSTYGGFNDVRSIFIPLMFSFLMFSQLFDIFY